MMIWRSRQDQDNKEKQELYFYFLVLDILSKLDIRSRAMGLSHTHLLVRFMASKRFSNSISNLVFKVNMFGNKPFRKTIVLEKQFYGKTSFYQKDFYQTILTW